MNHQIFKKLIRISDKLDKAGKFTLADKIQIKIAQYYPEQSTTVVDNTTRYVKWKELEPEIEENQKNYNEKFPPLMKKQYFDLGGEKDGLNINGQLHGPDSTPGPAYIDPGNLASSPSMAGDSTSFTWEDNYQKNEEEGNSWKNRIPMR